jgi:hypothetical protein
MRARTGDGRRRGAACWRKGAQLSSAIRNQSGLTVDLCPEQEPHLIATPFPQHLSKLTQRLHTHLQGKEGTAVQVRSRRTLILCACDKCANTPQCSARQHWTVPPWAAYFSPATWRLTFVWKAAGSPGGGLTSLQTRLISHLGE